MRRLLAIASVVGSAMLLESCNDGLLHAPAPAGPAIVTMRASLSATAAHSSGGPPEAFDRADQLFLRFRVGDDVRLEQELPFSPSAAGTTIRLEIPLRDLTETMNAEMELRGAGRALFRGSATPTLSAGNATPVDFTLEPVVAGVVCGSGIVQLGAYGETAQLSGAAIFATNDTVRGVPVTWSTPASSVASVGPGGDVTAQQDGDVLATCTAAGFTATRTIRVFAVVTNVQLLPGSATLIIGNSLTYTARLLDARGNPITTPRPMVWSSSNSAIAGVNASGVVTATAAGQARIDLTSGTAVGSSNVTVVSPSSVVTSAAVDLTGTSVRMLGIVNPRGASTQAWFEWGTDPTLSTFTATTTQAMGSGTTDVALSQAVTGLVVNTTYYFRAVATSAGGTVRGSIVAFTTARPPSATTTGADPSTTQFFTVRGSVNPNGYSTEAWFEWGTSPTLATSTATTKQAIGSGQTPVTVAQGLGALQPFTTYYVRMVATNVGGSAAGAIVSFRTGGSPTIGATSGVGPTGNCQTIAQLTSSANPNGLATEGWFEYGTSSTLATFAATAHQALGAGTSFATFSAGISTSSSSTGGVYARSAASNGFGTVRSAIIGPFFPALCVR